MHRALAQSIEDQKAPLDEEETHHLVRVLRMRPGDRFLAHDGKGHIHLCALARESADWYGEVLAPVESRSESNLHVVLAQSLIKKDKFEWVIQKAVELGVREIVPFVSWRTEVLPEGDAIEHRMRRWRKIVVDAFKQSGRAYLPVLQEPVKLSECLEKWQADLTLALDEAGNASLRDVIKSHPGSHTCLFFVGPEGGWDERDRELFDVRKIPRVGLGPRILRTETAPVVLLAILQYELGDLG